MPFVCRWYPILGCFHDDADSINNEETARCRVQQAFSFISSFMNKNQLKLNPKKTMFIPFSRRRDPTTYSPLRLDDETIMSPVTKVRNLGVVSDSRSSFDSHIRELRKSCFYQLCRLNFVCAYIPSAQFAILIHSFITSRLTFATQCTLLCLITLGVKYRLSRTVAQNVWQVLVDLTQQKRR